MVYNYYIYMAGAQRGRAWCEFWMRIMRRKYAAAVGAIGQVLVAVCSACAGAI